MMDAEWGEVDCALTIVEPLLPYAGSSGWSGSDTSKERADRDDKSGVTGQRQSDTLRWLQGAGPDGVTWSELGAALGMHHGSASGVLSVLHKEGRIARLRDVRRKRCSVYVALEYVNDRPTASHKSNGAFTRDDAADIVIAFCEANHITDFLPCDCRAIAVVLRHG